MKFSTQETAHQIVQRSGSNLAFALAVLPKEKRGDMEVFYAFCRVIDDLADDPGATLSDRVKGLSTWRKLINQETEPDSGIAEELVVLQDKYQLSADLLDQIIAGVEMDLEPLRFQTHEELKNYCFHVASAVGLISIEIFGYQEPDTKLYAENLGYALQWTNIMRDVGEDAQESRIYLPLENLEAYNITEASLLEGKVDQEKFAELMASEAKVARKFYQLAIEHLPEQDRPAMKSPELMRKIYTGILDKMEADRYQVFDQRYRLSKARMLFEFVKAKLI